MSMLGVGLFLFRTECSTSIFRSFSKKYHLELCCPPPSLGGPTRNFSSLVLHFFLPPLQARLVFILGLLGRELSSPKSQTQRPKTVSDLVTATPHQFDFTKMFSDSISEQLICKFSTHYCDGLFLLFCSSTQAGLANSV